jgi:protein-tyrosine-phosphatase
MAMVLLSDAVKQNGEKPDQWRIESAGCWAMSGLPATQTAILAMRERGLDLEDHRSRPINESLLEQFNLILCMERGHKTNLQRNFPSIKSRVYLLSEMLDNEEEIQDPVGMPPDMYKNTANEIQRILQYGFKRIKQLSSSTLS